MRSWHVRRRLDANSKIWPMDPLAGEPPASWPGWPSGKRFALVLTHDVESAVGYENVKALVDLEMSLGFRSIINFVPEGNYRVSRNMIAELASNGFEIGVHGLKHDGKLFQSKRIFENRAKRINDYLHSWNCKGFRAPYMHHRLHWMHLLNMEYDMSTFDTDPFEPEPDGVGTIFPFWVGGAGGDGYLEIPYTLPQDSTLFNYMGETTGRIWERKLSWIAERGGMACITTHPDFMSFENGARQDKNQYPVKLYASFLEKIKETYDGEFWMALPRELNAFLADSKRNLCLNSTQNNQKCWQTIESRKCKIWIDLENTPHIPFFKPIIEKLERKKYRIVVTARDAFQTCQMADKMEILYKRIGRHYGKNPVCKVLGLIFRAMQLCPFALKERPNIAINHGSRAQILICNLLRIPSVMLMDYEHSNTPPLVHPWWEIVPESLSTDGLHCKKSDKILKYKGIKEDVYVQQFQPQKNFLEEMGLPRSNIVVTVRPPATEAHYHNPESEILFTAFMDRAIKTERVRLVLLPRNKQQLAELRRKSPHWFEGGNVIVPRGVVNGLDLLWNSDLVVSGGGTMNREAAALGVPVYSIFRGKIGNVDRFLRDQNRLVLIENEADVFDKIHLDHRDKINGEFHRNQDALTDIVNHLENIITEYRR